MIPPRQPFERNLGWIVVIILFAGCLLVLRPFVSALLWGAVLCSASWPLYRRLTKAVGNRRTLAALIMTLGMLLLLLLPFIIVGVTLGDNVQDLSAAVQKEINAGPPDPPAWLAKVPLVGAKAVDSWKSLANDSEKLKAKLKEWMPTITSWLLKGGLVLGSGLLQLTLSIFITFFLFRDGSFIAERLSSDVGRIAGDRGVHLLALAGKTVRGVVYGILGTALAGIGFLIAGVPGAIFLALLTFFSSVVPVIGTGLVWIPAAIWLFSHGSTGYGIFLIVWGLGVGQVDNFVKPWLISQGSDMPFLLIFFGVIGGALTFGFIGVFLGPTLLAVGYRLITEWHAMHRGETLPDKPPVAAGTAA